MPYSDTFDDFRLAFFGIFTSRSFKGGNFLSYLERPVGQRGGDEASVVDTAIVGPLLGLLGFEPGERTYNEQHQADRPDFLPRLAGYGECFVVEDKNTTLGLTLDMATPQVTFRRWAAMRGRGRSGWAGSPTGGS